MIMIAKLKQLMVPWLIKKIQRHGSHRVQVLGKTYAISEKVFNPKYYFTSKFMAENIKVNPWDVVLDIGTGSGIQAITAGETASKVVAIDINPEAVRFAKKNIMANGMEDVVFVVEGDLFSPLNSRQLFSVILFTPPYLEGMPRSDFERALFDPCKKLVRRFFRDAKNYLKPGGYVQMLYSSITDPERVLEIARELGWIERLVIREKTFSEEFLIYTLTRN